MMLKGQIEVKTDRKQRISDLAKLSKMVTEQVLGEITKIEFIKRYKGPNKCDIQDGQRPEWRLHIEENHCKN